MPLTSSHLLLTKETDYYLQANANKGHQETLQAKHQMLAGNRRPIVSMFPANKGNANQRRPPALSILKRNHSCQQRFQPGQHWDFQRWPAPAQKTAEAVTSQSFMDQKTQDLPGWEEQMLTSIPGLPSSRGRVRAIREQVYSFMLKRGRFI